MADDIYFGIETEEKKVKSSFRGAKETVYYNCRQGTVYFEGQSHKSNQIQDNKCQPGDVITIIVDFQELKISWRKNGIPIL